MANNQVSVEDISRELIDYLCDTVELSPENIRVFKSCLLTIRELSPSDVPNIISKMERLINLSADLSWIITIMNRRLHEMNTKLKKKKDPKYVMLVKQGRPSSAAIDSEIRFTDNEMYDIENNIEILKNTIEYFNKISDSIEKYQWLLKDKLNTRE